MVTLREYVPDLTRRIDWRVGREMLSFAWPGIIGGLAFYALGLLDRFFVKHYHGLADAGLYGVAFRYSQVVLVAVLAFRMGWGPWHYPWLRSGRHPQMVARGTLYYFFATGFLAVLVSAWMLPVFHLLMPEQYWDAVPAIAPLSLAAVATGAYTIFHVGFNVTKRMRLVPLLAVCGAGLAVGLYFLLIPPFSFVGAAWATAAAFTGLSLLVLAVSNRIYPVPWDWRRMGLAIGLTVGGALLSLGVDAWLSVPVSIPVRLAITAAYPLLLYALGFFPPGDLAACGGASRPSTPRLTGLRHPSGMVAGSHHEESALSLRADPRIGTELAGYRIERLLGRGGMSVVYLAEDPRSRTQGGVEAAHVRARRGRALPGALSQRVAARCLARPSECDPRLRGRRSGRIALHRHALRGRNGPEAAHRRRGLAGADPRGGHPRAGCRCTRCRARARPRAP